MDNKRTNLQNNSLHLWCRELAQTLNDAGISQRLFLENFEIDNTEESIKIVFREIGKMKYGKDSTAKLNRSEIIAIYDEINRHVAVHGIHVPWPTIEEFRYDDF